MNIFDHYWQIASDATQVYSSKRGLFVPADDETYQAWLANGGLKTTIASVAELGEVLAPYALRPTDPDVLEAYKDSQAVKLTIEVVAKVIFNHENRMRSLEGKGAITANQFKNHLKGML